MAFGFIFNQNNGITINVGVLIAQGDTDGITDDFSADNPLTVNRRLTVRRQLFERMRFYGQNDCVFIPYANEEQMKQDVAAHKLECAYVLTAAVEDYATDGAIITYRSPMTVTDKVLDLLTAAAYLEVMAGELGAEILIPYLDASEGTLGTEDSRTDGSLANDNRTAIAEDIQQRAEDYLQAGALMDMRLIETGRAVSVADAPYKRLLHTLTGLFGWLVALLTAMGLAGDTEKAVAVRLKTTGRRGYRLAGYAVVFSITALFLCITLCAGAWLFPGTGMGWKTEILMSLTYALALTGTSVLLASWLRADAFPAVISFVFIFGALAGGTAFDIREVLASVSFLRYFCLNYYYAYGVLGDSPWCLAAVLTVIGLVSGTLDMLTDRLLYRFIVRFSHRFSG